MIARKKSKSQSKDDSDEELRLCLTIAPDEDKEIDYELLDIKYPIIEWKSEYHGIKPQYDEAKELEEINVNVVTRSNGQKRYFSTLMRVLSIFDREDLKAIYELVIYKYQDETPKGWKLHNSSGVHTIMTNIGLIIHMLVELKYPLKKEVLSQMLDLKLETEEDSTMAQQETY
ncbi:hypothetical protein Tco_1334095 [Tanacetum coccineum]